MRGVLRAARFCSITGAHGADHPSRSKESVLGDVNISPPTRSSRASSPTIGGATANMSRCACTDLGSRRSASGFVCASPGCSYSAPTTGPLVEFMKEARGVEGIRKVFVSVGVRMYLPALAHLSPEYSASWPERHVIVRLKFAPEHTSPKVVG